MCEIKARLTICGFGTESQRDSRDVKYLHLRTNNNLSNQLELKQRMVLCGKETAYFQERFLWGSYMEDTFYVVISLYTYIVLRTFLVDMSVLSLWVYRKKTFTLPIVDMCGQWVVLFFLIKHLIASKRFLLFPSLLQKSEKTNDGW